MEIQIGPAVYQRTDKHDEEEKILSGRVISLRKLWSIPAAMIGCVFRSTVKVATDTKYKH